MIHHIIVKWKDGAGDRSELLMKVRELYALAGEGCGVEEAEVIPNCIPRDNRYDLMIRLHMKKEDLPLWDASELHRTWKEEYSDRIEKKAIFDCE